MYCSTNVGERTIFHSEETKTALDLLYVYVCDKERLVSPQGGEGQVWVCRRWGPSTPQRGARREGELQYCHCFVVLCPFLQRRLGPPVRSSQWGNGRQVREQEDAPCSPETLLTCCVKHLMISDTDLVKDLEGVIPLPLYSRFSPSQVKYRRAMSMCNMMVAGERTQGISDALCGSPSHPWSPQHHFCACVSPLELGFEGGRPSV